MTTALEKWQARSVREVELPSGTKIKLRLTNVQDEILAGSFSAPILALAKKVAVGNLDEEDVDEETLRNTQEFMRTMISKSVVELDGEPISLSLDDVKDLPADDVDEIWAYIRRLKALPSPKA